MSFDEPDPRQMRQIEIESLLTIIENDIKQSEKQFKTAVDAIERMGFKEEREREFHNLTPVLRASAGYLSDLRRQVQKARNDIRS